MLEGLVAWVLNTYVGEYVENLNTDQLSIALLQGAVELENLPLKKDALKSLDLPLEVKAGFIGKITLQIPVRRLRSEQWVISMEKLYLVAGPVKKTHYDEDQEKQYDQTQKEAMLRALEEHWQVQTTNKAEGYGSSWLSYGTSLASNILENLQLNVKDVHIRYEDDQLNPSSPFACGVVIKSLSAQSTDGQWVPKFVSRGAADMMRKLVDLQNFSMYLDTDAVLLGNLPLTELMIELERETYQTSSTHQFKPHDYILSPVTAQAKMTRNTSPLPLRSARTPRISLDIQLEQIPVSLSELQYRGLVLWLKEFERHDKRRKYRKWKPACTAKENPISWWKFAFEANMHQIRHVHSRATWSFVLQRARDNVIYHKAYMSQLSNEYMDGKLKDHQAKMEEEMSFEELKILRELAYEKRKKEKALAQAEKPESAVMTEASPPRPVQPVPAVETDKLQEGGGLFRGWFPGWGGWYGGSSQSVDPGGTTEEQVRQQTVGEPPPDDSDVDIEQEILDVIHDSAEDNTLLRRDAVFAVLNFSLKSGSFKLMTGDTTALWTGMPVMGKPSQSLLEMECTTINSTFVSRPRTGALKFEISVGGLYLRDKITEGTIFPTLVAPQARERIYGQNRPVLNMRQKMSGTLPAPSAGIYSSMSKPDDGEIFQLTWERKPPNSSAYYRVSMQTKPLDIIYNPVAARRVSDFFTHPNRLGMATKPSELQLTAAARSHYENLKEQTKAELRQTIDSLLEGEGGSAQSKRWEVNLDVCAPQLIIPENFCDANTTMVVLDLGNLLFHNASSPTKPRNTHIEEDKASNDTEDDFKTPMTTPPNETEAENGAAKNGQELAPDFSQLQNLSESAMHDRLYDTYTLELSDLQVLVGRARDNWRHAHFKGTSHLHVIDRFTISLQLERRLLYTTDPQWPSATLSGTLPSLTIHMNEQKVQAIRTCATLLMGETGAPVQPSTSNLSQGDADACPLSDAVHEGYTLQGGIPGADNLERQSREIVEESRLLMMQFTISEASLQIQSQGKAIAELQVGGVRANLTKRPFASSISFTVHSLLVVDAMQTFGQDFELLIASHKSLCLDSRSGSMRDSDPNSPSSPQSPQSPRESPAPTFSSPGSLQAVHTALTSTFQSLMPSCGGTEEECSNRDCSRSPKMQLPGLQCPMSPVPDSEALITLDFEMISAGAPSYTHGDEDLQIANVQFNSLDVIANQETIMEILAFFKRILPSDEVTQSESRPDTVTEKLGIQIEEKAKVKTKTELTADFNRLNILLMTVVEDKLKKTARKVATATMSSARIQATFDENLYVEGSLGGLQLLDVTPEGAKYQKVFSVGHDPSPHGSFKFTMQPPPDMYRTAHEAFTPGLSRLYDNDLRAFTFNLNKPGKDRSWDISMAASPSIHLDKKSMCMENLASNSVDVCLKMASLCYTHCPRFLTELSQCASEFKDYMNRLASSLRYAATEVAMGIVHKRSDLTSSTMYGSTSSLDTLGWKKQDFTSSDFNVTAEGDNGEMLSDALGLNIVIDAMLESPVIVLPRTPLSSEALVAHLGNISIRNSDPRIPSPYNDSLSMSNAQVCGENKDRIYIEFRNMNLYSVNIDQEMSLESQGSVYTTNLGPASTTTTMEGDSFSHKDSSVPIIYDTTIELTIDMVEPDYTIINPDVTQNLGVDEDFMHRMHDESIHIENTQTVMSVNARIATPLKLVLSKKVYEQIIESTDNLTYDDNEYPVVEEQNRTLDKIEEEREETIEPSMSALKLDGLAAGLLSKPKKSFQMQLEETKQEDKPLVVKVLFEVPEFNVEMRGDFGEGEQGLVDLRLQEFLMNYEKSNAYSMKFELTLKSLVMEDLLQDANSKHRQLMVSTVPGQEDDLHMKPKLFLSTSCPDSTIFMPTPTMPSSLPCSFHEHQQNVFVAHQQKSKLVNLSNAASKKKHGKSEDYPLTPPPSPRLSRKMSEDTSPDALVHINFLMIDKKSPEYVTKYNKTNRFVDVDFNGLDTTINLQTWVVLLDFLGMGAKIHDVTTLNGNQSPGRDTVPGDTQSDQQTDETEDVEEIINTEVNLKVNSLSLTLNKPEYELARANVCRLSAHVSLRDQNFAMTGQLGSMSLLDQSPHGKLYTERFLTVGEQALDFDFFKYGLPDPNLQREFDMSLTLRMASVRYVHTNRFQAETVAFCQHFLQLQDVLGRMRAASAGKKVSETASVGSRILLDMQADTPIILVPHSSRSTDILVLDLGNLTVNNKFLFDGQNGTIKFQSMPGTKDTTPSHDSSSGDLLSNMCPSSNNDILSGSQYAHGMTQSIFDECFPPSTDVDPMTQSVYGSLEHDYRSDIPPFPTTATNGEVYDPTYQPPTSLFKNGKQDGLTSSVVGTSLTMTDSVGLELGMSSSSSASSPTGSASAQQRRAMFAGVGMSPPRRPTLRSTDSASSGMHICLLDVMSIMLSDMGVYSAERVDKHTYDGNLSYDMEFPSCVVKRRGGSILKDKCMLNLQVERNLEGDISHAVPDFCVSGALTSVHFSVDLSQYKLVRGILDHNLGEPLEEFQRPLMSHLQDPKIQTVLSGDVWKCISMGIDLHNVTVELMTAHCHGPDYPEASLAKLGFITSRLCYESYSDQSRDVDLVSHEIVATDTRYNDTPMNARPNVFVNILQPSKSRERPSSMQLELHFRSMKESTRFTVLLNNMRLMCVVDWLLTVQDFLLTNADNPFQHVQERSDTREVTRSMSDSMANRTPGKSKSPLTLSGGIVTKRGPYIEQVQAPFEMRLNVIETEFVVVEDMTTWDTNAVILKSTAVMTYKPKSNDRPLSCSLQSLEVFSCSLVAEEETALSIIDPMTISIELNANPLPIPRKSASAGLLDITDDFETPLLLEVSFNTLNIRLSYNDLKLFLSILDSLPKQADQAKNQQINKPRLGFPEKDMRHLEELSFRVEDCERAMRASGGRVNDAALWLTLNASPIPMSRYPEKKKDELNITALELKATSICICLIDDCKDADVPLAEISFNGTTFHQTLSPRHGGKAMFQLVGDFYNRALSGWEPFIEPWRCHVNWEETGHQLNVRISASEVLNFNLTSSLISQYNKTKLIWTEDYYKNGSSSVNQASNEKQSNQLDKGLQANYQRRRVPFVPFTLHNDTGSPLWFLTVTTTPSKVPAGRTQKLDDAYIQATSWRMVGTGQDMPFFIQDREKMRHKKTHELRVHQLVVKVDGWQRVSPVSIDKVGVYFRHAGTELKASVNPKCELPPARIVFDVKQQGSAKKVVTVRSALMMVNKLSSTVHIKMENMETNDSGFTVLKIPVASKVPIPLKHVSSRLWVKPTDWPVDFCDRAIHWHHVMKPGETSDGIRKCVISPHSSPYRFCVAVKRENYPEERQQKKGVNQGNVYMLPGHTITLVPTVIVVNLLPIELNYYMKGTDIKGTIKPGKEAPLHTADLSQALELGVLLENFVSCKELMIPPGTIHYKVKLRLYDTDNRLLELLIRILSRKGGSLRLSVSAPFWLVNKSGLPLIFKQDFSKPEAAGQFAEHELARCVTPLLFCYAEKESPYMCTMRVGKSVHGPNAIPNWCARFPLESGVGMRQLHVIPRQQNRPDWLVDVGLQAQRLWPSVLFSESKLQVYNIGIEIRQGRGQYRDTNIVTFAPRFEIDNRSRHKLAISQRHLAKDHPNQNPDGFLLALPSCKLPYHWPRLDLDQLLCIRLVDHQTCQWSGGFRIDRIDSFHVNMRDSKDWKCLLLKVEILLQGPTFFIVFTDSEELPPPFRIDNCSEVPVLYHQTKVTDEHLKTFVREHTSINYAWDEPILAPHISLNVQGGNSSTYNMDVLGEGEQLYYQNFVYLVASATFKGKHPTNEVLPPGLEKLELVLDVQHNNHVVFRKKEQGKRSQLWRVTSQGRIEHEGSAPPRDPRKPPKSGHSMVLDIADIAAQPGKFVPLMLKKPDERRKSAQTWKFTEDGRLCSSLGDQSVQAISGTDGLQYGALVVLGPTQKLVLGVAPHLWISRQSLRPGSGCLSVCVLMDGPTRVLKITDTQTIKRFAKKALKGLEEWELYDEDYNKTAHYGSCGSQQEPAERERLRDLHLTLNLKGGFGISLVNHLPEELIYVALQDIIVDYSATSTNISLDTTVANIQIDNQRLGSQRKILLYVTPQNSRDVKDNTPALHLTAHNVPNSKWNAEIFRHMIISMKKLTVQLEERLLWKLLQFIGYNQSDPELEKLEESDYDSQKALTAATSVQAKRYYFGTLKINTSRLTLSMVTASKLSADLQAIKESMSIPLVKFEEAKVDLDPFVRFHPFETSTFLINEIMGHYTEELKSQAAKILGSVDFLGNPLGLFNDMAEGISGLIKDGNVGGLLKNVTHGFSNTAAKFTGSLSDGLGSVTMDDKHNQTREQIKMQHGSGSGHLVAGIKGLGYGLFGGLTSIVSQTYEGTKEDGLEGFFTGLGKGVVGTVTKPVAGVLDFASEAASAVRDTSKSSSRHEPSRIRHPRCCHGPGALLPVFSRHHAEAQKFLYTLNENNFTEFYVAMEQMRCGPEDSLRALITSEQVYFLKRGGPDLDNIVFKAHYGELDHCNSVAKDMDGSSRFYVELRMKSTVSNHGSKQQLRSPQVRCDKEIIAQKVAQQILYAKSLHDERNHTLVSDTAGRDMDQ